MNQTRKRGRIVLAVVLVLAVLAAALPRVIGSITVDASTMLVTNEQTMEAYRGSWQLEGFDEDRFMRRYQIETVRQPSSFDDHILPFDLITAPGNRDIVVMAHGMLGNRLTNYPTAEIFLENGYNVISYDQRSSGENYAQRSTFGYWEKYDLIDCIRYARQRDPEARIAVWGESFGGATALLGVAHEDVQEMVSVLILDCPVSRMEEMVRSEMGKMGLPLPLDWLMRWGSEACRRKLGFAFEDADGLEAAAKITVPTLVFNSKADQITPESMGQDVYESLAAAKKELYTSEQAAHIEIRLGEREIYTEKILDFIA